MKSIFLLPLFCLSVVAGAQNWMYDFEEASVKAQKEGKLILLHFSGSDWDTPSRQMKEFIFESPAFQQYSDDQLILVQADFPRKIKNRLSRAQLLHNEALAEQYNTEAQFPKTLLLEAKGKVIHSWKGNPNSSPDIFIAGIKQFGFRANGQKAFTHTAQLMGSRFDFTVVCSNQDWADRCFESVVTEVTRIEKMLTSKTEDSEVAKINNNAGIKPVVVEEELLELISEANKISMQTRGAFDLTFAGLDKKIWPLNGSLEQRPDSASLAEAIRLIDYRKVIIDDSLNTVFLAEKEMEIGFEDIKKGYAVEKAKALLRQRGITSGVIKTGGNLITWGKQPNGEDWTIAAAGSDEVPKFFSNLKIKEQAVVSSYESEKFVTLRDENYKYIIDPRFGYIIGGLKSVSIICPNATLADALATALFVMGESEGIDLINQLEGVECIILDEAGELYTSHNIEVNE